MKKLATFATVSLLAISLTACGDANSNSKNSSSKTAQSSPVTMTKYRSIKIGMSSMAINNDGSTKQDVQKKFGKPSTVTKSEINGKTTAVYTWDKLNRSFKAKDVTVSFEGNHAIAKSFTNLDINRIKPLSKQKLNSIKTGDSYDSVITKLGSPNADSVAGSGSFTTEEAMYLTDKKGSAVSFTFTGDKLISKTETTMK